MKKIVLLSLVISIGIFIIPAYAFSQSKSTISVSGTVLDEADNSPVLQASVQFLNKEDSTMITGCISDMDGRFSLKVSPGKYILKLTFVGYKPRFVDLNLSSEKQSYNIGRIMMSSDAIMLNEAVVTAEAPQVTVKEDSLIFNASAYRTPQGAMLEELIKKLPGAEIDDDGNITINGKSVTKLMVDGKEFFGGDVETGLKNLPVDMIENVKSYDRKSDLARITGIDDGEEETVIDLTVKKGMNNGWFGNIDLAGATEERYSGKAMINKFNDHTQISVIASMNNVNDEGFSGGGGRPRMGSANGLSTKKIFGVNFATETEKVDMGGSIRYNYDKNDAVSTGYSEMFLQSGSSFSNSNSSRLNKNESIDAEYRLEWKPDSMTNIIFRPRFFWTNSNSNEYNQSATFDDDPFTITDSPNDYLDFSELAVSDPLKDVRVNGSNDISTSKSYNYFGEASLQLNRKLNDKGRNITFRGEYRFGNSGSDVFSDSETRYYQFAQVPDSSTIRHRFMTTPGKSYYYKGQLIYSEPVARATYLQLSYEFKYDYSDTEKSAYSLEKLFPDWNINLPLPDNYEDTYDAELSKNAKYETFNHEIMLGLRFVREKYQLNAGMFFQPQTTRFTYMKGEYSTDTVRNVFNFSPTLDFRYRFSKVSQLKVNYRGRSTQPGMESLLPVTDDSNPLKVFVGNPGLKPSFTHSMNAFFNTYNADKQRGMMASLMMNLTQDGITNVTQYNAETGGTKTMPENINGNWNIFGIFNSNTALKNKKFTVNTSTMGRYNNQVSFLYNDISRLNDRNKVTNLSLVQRLNLTYRNDWFEFGLNGSLEYSWEKSMLQPEKNQQPYVYSYGANTTVYMPWSLSLSTNIINQSRRGYADSSFNRDELVWNAQLAKTFFKGAATVSVEMYDILKNKSNIVRSLTDAVRSVYQYNSINSYFMVHFIYRLNIFGNKKARSMMNDDFRGFPGEGPGMGGDRPPRREGGF